MTAPSIGLVKAATDPKLLGGDATLFPKQLEILRAIESTPLGVLALGRRSGKTLLAAKVALHHCLLRPDLDRFAKLRYALVVAARQDQANELLRVAGEIVNASPMLQACMYAETATELRFRTLGGAKTTLRAVPTSTSATRGMAASIVILDEVAHFEAAREVFQAVAPSIATFGAAGQILLVSTPYGTEGLFAEMFDGVSSGALPGYAFQAPSADVNPMVTSEFLSGEQLRLGHGAYATEYLAEFVASGGDYFEHVEATADGPARPDEGSGWVAGLDFASKQDPCALAIVGRSNLMPGKLLHGLTKRWVPKSAHTFETVRRRQDDLLAAIAEECQAFGVHTIVCDQHMAYEIQARMSSAYGLRVVPNPMSAVSQTEVFRELRAALLMDRLALYNDPQLIAELRAVRTDMRVGRSEVSLPRTLGGHCDIAQALALAVHHQRFRSRGDARPRRQQTTDTLERRRASFMNRAGGEDAFISTLSGRDV